LFIFIHCGALKHTKKKGASECKSAIYSFTAHHENKLVSNDNIGAFYRYANNKLCTKSSIGPLLRSDGSLTSDPPEKAELLQCVFAQNYTADNVIVINSNWYITKRKFVRITANAPGPSVHLGVHSVTCNPHA
jgi:hypothetical protein